MKTQKKQRGFTLLLASLIASLVLLLGSSIYELASKEIILSSIGRDSQFAFYAADGAAECALYWDVRFQTFSTTTPPSQVACDGQTATVSTSGTYPPSEVFQFQYQPNGYCADVSVVKLAPGANSVATPCGTLSNTGSGMRTYVCSNGYNVRCSDISNAARALERSVQLNY